MNFYDRVYRIARQIPKGKAATYGQIAAMVSTPRAARVVGFAMRALPDGADVPWQRVINSQGRISIVNWRWSPADQAKLLRAEGVPVVKRGGDYWVDLDTYLWTPNRKAFESRIAT